MDDNKKKTETGVRAVLQFLSKVEEYSSLKLQPGATIIGREKGDLIINDPEISSTHCQIQLIDSQYHIFDMNSTNGTYVNSERVLRHKLVSEDRITIGKTVILFVLEDEKKVKAIPSIAQSKQEPSSRTKNKALDTLIGEKFKGEQKLGLKITVTYSHGQPEVLQIPANTITLGRGSNYGKFDQDPQISRRHITIKINGVGEVFVEDLGSTNGSFINGKRIEGIKPASPEDEVKIGSCKLKIEVMQREP